MTDKITVWYFTNDVTEYQSPKTDDQKFHAYRRILDALKNGLGTTVCSVEIWGDVKERDGRMTGRFGRVLWAVDGANFLRRFAQERDDACIANLEANSDAARAVAEAASTRLIAMVMAARAEATP